VIGVAAGNIGRHVVLRIGGDSVFGYLISLPFGLTYLVHGIPEVASYFLGSLAGGIISVAVSRHHYRDERFWNIVKDSMNLIILSLLVLVFAALVEVYITPLLR
jgi:uncharacterized membrane protein SpoIIM required for sporulation